MSKITINKTNGGLNVTPITKDHISGLLFFINTMPQNWLSGVGNWATATVYAVGAIVYDTTSKQYYKAITAHTAAATFAADAAKWEVYTKTAKLFTTLAEVEAKGITKGIASYSYVWYHAAEYFRTNPNGELYIYIVPVPVGSYTYNEIYELQKQVGGEIRQVGVFANAVTFATAEIDALQLVTDKLEAEYMPLQIVYGADFTSFTFSTLPDLSELSTAAPNVSVVILTDGDAYGSTLSKNAAVGTTLGVMSKAKVNESIGWVQKFNIASTEFNVPKLVTGEFVEDLTATQIEGIDDKHYLFGVKHTGITGTYFYDSWTCDAVTSDYNDIQLNRTYQKAFRGIRENLLPLLNSPIKVKTGGLLSNGAVSSFETSASKPLFDMTKNGELSDYSVVVLNVDNIFETKQIKINIRMLPIGTAREVIVSLGFSVNV